MDKTWKFLHAAHRVYCAKQKLYRCIHSTATTPLLETGDEVSVSKHFPFIDSLHSF